jgi:outer membrane protein insertion porin family
MRSFQAASVSKESAFGAASGFVLFLLLFLVGGCSSSGEAAPEAMPGQSSPPEIRVEGAASFSKSELLAVIANDLDEFLKVGLDRPHVDDLAYSLEIYYRTQGFPDAFIGYEFQGNELDADTPPLVRFQIEEGSRVSLRRFNLQGIEANGDPDFDKERLRLFFDPPSALFGEETWWYVEAQLKRGAAALEDYYFAKGYLTAKVTGPDLVWLDQAETRAQVTVTVEEGQRWVLSDTQLSISGNLNDARSQALEKVLRSGSFDKDGRPRAYSLRLTYGLRAKLLEACGQWGYLDASCTLVESEVSEGLIQVLFQIELGPVVRLGEIIISGDHKSRDSFLRGRLDVEPGDVLDSRDLRSSFSRLFATGLYRTVSLEPRPRTGENPQAAEVERDLVLEVLEAPSIEVTVEPGFGSYEGLRMRLGIENENILGTGRTGQAHAKVGALAQGLTLGLGDRSLFDSDFAGSAALYFDQREEPSFTLRERGIALSVSRPWPEQFIESSIGLRFRRADVFDIEIEDSPSLSAQEELDISSLSLTVTRDTRDGFFTPTEGSFARAQIEWATSALGSEIDYLRWHLETAKFQPLPWEGGVLGASFETSVIAPLNDTTVIPLQVRLFNGGENTVRSFSEDALGKLDSNGEALGGEAFSVISLELRQRVAGPFSTALFYDAGNLELDHQQYFDFDDMRQAIGIGLRYALPIGPIRLDAAWNPDAREEEDDWVLHFSVGLSF